jgi:hypothetical protein
MIRDQLKGAVRFDWRAEGLVCEIEIPEPAPAATSDMSMSLAAK